MKERIYRAILSLGLMLLVASSGVGQGFSNSWIDYSQSYYKVKTANEGLYKISYDALMQNQVPLAGADPRKLKMYFRGEEIAIKISGQEDGVWNTGDYLEFYGSKNDGTLDKKLLKDNSLSLTNPYVNLYSDSVAYFFTLGSSTSADGKRIARSSLNNSGGLSQVPYHWHEEVLAFANNYNIGLIYPFSNSYYTSSSYLDNGEGWVGLLIYAKAQRQYTLAIENVINAGVNAELSVQLVGRNNLPRSVNIGFGASEPTLKNIHNATFDGLEGYYFTESIATSELSGNQALVKFYAENNDRYSAAYLKLRYPQALDMANKASKVFRVPASANQALFEVKNVKEGTRVFDISDKDNMVEISATIAGSLLTAVLPSSTTERTLYLESVENGIEKITERSFTSWPVNADYLIISHKALRQAADGSDPVASYAAYRASASGGSFNVALANADLLYDEFGYGEPGPVAIRHFVEYMSRNQNPKHLFLLGKSITLTYRYFRQPGWRHLNHDYVPTFGSPGADLPYVMRLNGSGNNAAFAVGRVGARTPEDVISYLNKVKETENDNEQNLWKKRVLHLSGGQSQQEANTFRNYLRLYQQTAENPYYGAKVQTITKAEDAVVQQIDISKEVNNGLGLITFFGHSAPSLTDIEIGYVSDDRTNYNNKGLYPIILVNGCNAGDIYLYNNELTFGEDWIITPDKGAINFLAHSSTGYNSLLNVYSRNFYNIAYTDESNLNLSVGEIQRKTITGFLQSVPNNEIALAQAEQIVLQGDPAVKLFGRPKADYATSNEEVQPIPLTGSRISANSDTFAIQVIASDFGKALYDSINVSLSYLEDGEFKLLRTQKFASPLYKDTLYYGVSIAELPNLGALTFKVTLNSDEKIPEVTYSNNAGIFDLVISTSGTTNVWPYPYAVVNDTDLKLKTQDINVLSPAKDYTLETSTSADFTGATQYTVNGRRLIEQTIRVAASTNDTLAYFWRSRIANPESNEDTAWTESSFTYLKNAPIGWAQINGGQFKSNNISGLQVTDQRNWTFNQIAKLVEVKTYGKNAGSYLDVEIGLDGFQFIIRNIGLNCPNNSLGAVHLNGNNLNAYRATVETCGRAPRYVNKFVPANITSTTGDYNFIKYIDEVPAGDWVILSSFGSLAYSSWPTEVASALQNIGLASGIISSLQDGEPFIVIGKKGSAPGTAVYARATGNEPVSDQTVTLSQTISGAAGIGYIETEPIGPAKNWTDLAYSITNNVSDSYTLKVIGISSTNQETVLVTKEDVDGVVDLSGITAAFYPRIKLRLDVSDQTGQTPPALKFWRVGYNPQPDGVLLADVAVKSKTELRQGQEYAPRFDFVNVSAYSFDADSLAVTSSAIYSQNSSVQSENLQIKSPSPGDSSAIKPTIKTIGQTGVANYVLTVNPVAESERLLTNNNLQANGFISILADSLKPYLDVAFDGVYITNGSIVSPVARVSIVIRDDNQFAPIQDTTGIQVYMRQVCTDCVAERVSLNPANVTFTPATENSNCKIEFDLDGLVNGKYVLEVQAADVAGNKAGKEPYAIMFEVVNEKTITNFYPYPNPFSTATRFVFTLTGNDMPSDFKIQIMTVTGRVVREIFKEELGQIHIGNNISEFAWDGTDQWGDKLANGVYLYRVVMSNADLNQWEASQRDSANTKAFKEGFGKLYILR